MSEHRKVILSCLALGLPFVAGIFTLGLYLDDFTMIGMTQNELPFLDHLLAFMQKYRRPFQFILSYGFFSMGYMDHPWPYHLVNTGLHLANAAVFGLLLHKLGTRRFYVLAGAALFLYLPTGMTTVFWSTCFIVGFSHLIATLPFLVLADVWKGRKEASSLWKAALLFPVAMACYEASAMLGVLYAGLVFLMDPGLIKRRAGQAAMAIPLATLALLFVLYIALSAGRFDDLAAAQVEPVEENRVDRAVYAMGHWPKQLYWDWFTEPRAALAQRTLTGDLDMSANPWAPMLALLAGLFALALVPAWRIERAQEAADGPLPAWFLFAIGLLAFLVCVMPTAMFGFTDRAYYSGRPGLCLMVLAVFHVASRIHPSPLPRAAVSAALLAFIAWNVFCTFRIAACFRSSWLISRELLDQAPALISALPENAVVVIDGVPDYVPAGFGKAKLWKPIHYWGLAKGIRDRSGRPDMNLVHGGDAQRVAEVEAGDAPIHRYRYTFKQGLSAIGN